MRAQHFVLLAAAALASVACIEGRVPTEARGLRPVVIRLSMHAIVGSSGHAVEVLARYARAAAPTTLIALDSATVALNSNDTQIAVQINIETCLNDPGRELPEGVSASNIATTCVLHLTATLLDESDQVIDQATLPPIPASPSAPVSTPAVALGVAVGKVTVSPRSTTINAIGYAVDLAVTAVDKQGQPIGRPSLAFKSLDPTIATVDSASGRVVARAMGMTKIVATSRDQADTATVTVQQVPKTLTLGGVTDGLFPGDSVELTAVARDSADVLIPASAVSVKYVSSNSAIALVNGETGQLRAVATGNVDVQAFAGPATATMTVKVSPFVVYAFCRSESTPKWVAYQRGRDGPWVHAVVRPDLTVRLPIPDVGGITMAFADDGESVLSGFTEVIYGSAAELQSVWEYACPTDASMTATFSGSVAGLSPAEHSDIYFGMYVSSWADLTSSTFTIPYRPDGPHDLVATSYLGNQVQHVIIRRGLNPAPGTTLPVLDFSSDEAFTPVQATATILGLGGRPATLGVTFYPRGDTVRGAWFGDTAVISGSAIYRGVPSSHLLPGDLLQLGVYAGDSLSSQETTVYLTGAADQAITIGPPLSSPTITVVGTSPSLRLRLELPSQAEYNSWVEFDTGQYPDGTTGTAERWEYVLVSATYLGGTPAKWTLTAPDLADVEGFAAAWALKPGVETQWDAYAWDSGFLYYETGRPAAGKTDRMADRHGVLSAVAVSPALAGIRPPTLSRRTLAPASHVPHTPCEGLSRAIRALRAECSLWNIRR